LAPFPTLLITAVALKDDSSGAEGGRGGGDALGGEGRGGGGASPLAEELTGTSESDNMILLFYQAIKG
jgi:hypothetical protein